jgi:ATP-dependent Clp protease ATP-binding subunit ClpB
MDMNRLTQKSQEALHDAQTKALRFGHVEVDGEHLLLALLDQGEGLVAPLLARAGADPDRLARTWRPSSAAARGSAGPA